MAHTYKHKLGAKFRRKLLPFSRNLDESLDISYMQLADFYPIYMKKMWNRQNFDVGYFRHLRTKKRIENTKNI